MFSDNTMRWIHAKYFPLLLTPLLAGWPLTYGWAAEAEENRWHLCPTPFPIDALQRQTLNDIPPGEIHGYADSLTSSTETILLRGHVQVDRQGIRLLSELAEYDRQTDIIHLQGGVGLRSEDLLIEGDQASYSPGRQEGHFDQTRFFLPASHGFGRAESIRVIAPKQLELTQLHYTTCPPEQEDWLLSARRLTLNQLTNTGEAYHATLRFKGVPFFYSPYLNFPLAGRKSGMLPPSIGRSDISGEDVSLPIYWNIAPNQDATITPRHLSKRGSMLGAEYRFLGRKQAGEIQLAWLPDDQLSGEDRSELKLHYQARLADNWRSELRYHRVSDVSYYQDDLGGPDQSHAESQLERRVDLRYRDPYWRFLAMAQSYQTLAGTSPYQRLPQLQLRGATPRRYQQWQYSLQSEAVSFRHPDRLPTGERVDLKPSIALPLGGQAWFLTPSLSWRHTEYRIHDDSADSRMVRSMPLVSLDGGVFFERPLLLAGQGYTHTLEPRLYYLRVPYREQDALPLFDTAQTPFSYANLFRDNRFSGADRQGDANHLTVALGSRLFEDSSGKERASIAIAQVYHMADRRVTLTPSQSMEAQQRSDIIAEVGLSPIDSVTLRLTEQWDPYHRNTEQFNASLRYSPQKGQLFHAGYRYYRPDAQKQADITLLWPLSQRWRILTHHSRDLTEHRTISSLAGLEYDSCCWTVRLIGQARRNHIANELKHSMMLTLELKGLASLGQSLEQSIGRGILDD